MFRPWIHSESICEHFESSLLENNEISRLEVNPFDVDLHKGKVLLAQAGLGHQITILLPPKGITFQVFLEE
jgi:hypothetical protein